MYSNLAFALHAGWTRIDLVDRLEVYKYQQYFDQARGNGTRVIGILNCTKNNDYGCPYTQGQRDAWVHWAIGMMQAFKGRGVLWEVMNEPNGGNSDFFNGVDPTDSATKYTLLAQAFATAVNNPANGVYEEYVVGPALAHTNSDSQSWLSDIFLLGGTSRFDAVTVHPYDKNHRKETAEEEADELDDVLSINNNHGVPTYISEWGFKNQETTFQYAEPAREWLFSVSKGIPLVNWYSWTDDCFADKVTGVKQQFGLLTCDGQTKPAYWALKFVRDRIGGSRYVRVIASGAGLYGYQLALPNGKRQYVMYSDGFFSSANMSVPGSFVIDRIRWPGGDGSAPVSYVVSSEPAVTHQYIDIPQGGSSSIPLNHMPVVITEL